MKRRSRDPVDHMIARLTAIQSHMAVTGECLSCGKPTHRNQWNCWVHDDYLDTANDHDVKAHPDPAPKKKSAWD